jgi:hypothetical protein
MVTAAHYNPNFYYSLALITLFQALLKNVLELLHFSQSFLLLLTLLSLIAPITVQYASDQL